MNRVGLQVRRHCHRRLARTLLWTALVVAAAFAANVVGTYLLGSIENWAHWLAQTSGYFRLWRLGLYAVTLYGWLWMRRRLLARTPDRAAGRRLLCAEIAAVLAITTLEGSLLLRDL